MTTTITIITVDEHGLQIGSALSDQFTLPVVGDIVSECITLRPGVPPLGTMAFNDFLRDWHQQHNGENHAKP